MEELVLVDSIVDDKQAARGIVARVLKEFPRAWKKYLQDHRPRTDKPSPRLKREAYSPVFGTREVLRTLILAEVDAWEQQQADRHFTAEQRLKTLLRQLVILILNRNSYYAIVAVMQILCDYSAKDLRKLFEKIDPDRADSKNESTCSRAKGVLLDCLEKRLPDLQIRKRGSEKFIESRRPEQSEIDLVIQHLQALLPPDSTDEKSDILLDFIQNLIDRSRLEMRCIEELLMIDRFNALANRCGVDTFEERLRIPIFSDLSVTPPPSASNPDQSDIEIIKQLAAGEADRRNRIVQGSLRLNIDGFDYPMPSAPLAISEGSVVVKLVGTSSDFNPVVVDTLILSYEDPEIITWEPDIPYGNTCSFTFRPMVVDGRYVWQIEPLNRPQEPRIVFVVGASGCGKTSLVDALIANLHAMARITLPASPTVTTRSAKRWLPSVCREVSGVKFSHNKAVTCLWTVPTEHLRAISGSVTPNQVVAMFDVEQYSRQAALLLLRGIKKLGICRTVLPVLNKVDLDPYAAVSIAVELRELVIEEGFNIHQDFRVLSLSATGSLLDEAYRIGVRDLANKILFDASGGLEPRRIRDIYLRLRLSLCELNDALWLYVLKRSTVDQLFYAQGRCLQEFLVLAQKNRIDPNPAPRIYEPHERLIRICRRVVVIGAAASIVCLRLFSVPWISLPASIAAIVGCSVVAVCYRYGWSGRLSRRYARYGTALSLQRRNALADIDRISQERGARIPFGTATSASNKVRLAKTLTIAKALGRRIITALSGLFVRGE